MSEEPGGRRRTGGDRRFGRHVRSCRRARGLTQEVLAGLCDLSADTIRRLEQGSFSPSLDTLRKLCHGLQLRLSTLFESFELGDRPGSRELADAVARMTPEEQQALLQFVAVLHRRVDEDQD
ncbi:anaerobic benzoate catabolism transcriptional regulator [Enhygromyxa salina]|uniref:Anaerobic benzoate catabolism transcriptional regulator n=1 Tax=Enhygromyxa salina TaxID=215803 RepID=A0A2S9XXR7_9BACT|nr:helix-turn-helix transcriptional regulator [Enhygromyxa salina]PRP97667.1 anaerobic benzoate catabolism transcriptional regulator [Enhygromyxa salina]